MSKLYAVIVRDSTGDYLLMETSISDGDFNSQLIKMNQIGHFYGKKYLAEFKIVACSDEEVSDDLAHDDLIQEVEKDLIKCKKTLIALKGKYHEWFNIIPRR